MVNINDSPPRFSQDSYEAVLLLPTYKGVEVLRVEASDPDLTPDPGRGTPGTSRNSTQLVFSLTDGGLENFAVDPATGVVTVTNGNLQNDRYVFTVKVKSAAFPVYSRLCLPSMQLKK